MRNSRDRISAFITGLLVTLFTVGISGCDLTEVFQVAEPSPTPTFEPTNTTRLLPDLTINRITINFEQEQSCDQLNSGLIASIEVKNIGEGDSQDFKLEVNDSEHSFLERLHTGESVSLDFRERMPVALQGWCTSINYFFA